MERCAFCRAFIFALRLLVLATSVGSSSLSIYHKVSVLYKSKTILPPGIAIFHTDIQIDLLHSHDAYDVTGYFWSIVIAKSC